MITITTTIIIITDIGHLFRTEGLRSDQDHTDRDISATIRSHLEVTQANLATEPSLTMEDNWLLQDSTGVLTCRESPEHRIIFLQIHVGLLNHKVLWRVKHANFMLLVAGGGTAAGVGGSNAGNGAAQATGVGVANAPPGGIALALGLGLALSTPFGNIALSDGQGFAVGK